MTLIHDDCVAAMAKMDACSVDAVVCDPPYGLKFMGKRWDYDVPGVEVWRECLRVLKPGGHLLAFAGTRTQHRMACRIEDAGFEIRDMVSYLYDTNETARALIESLTPEQLKLLDATFGRDGMLGWGYGSGFPKSLDVSKAIDAAAGAVREVIGVSPNWRESKRDREKDGSMEVRGENAGLLHGPPATPAAREWSGWGTALKPALEPITMARKPLDGTVAANVLAHGCGGINVDGCRVDGKRWPANFIHDVSAEVVGLFPVTHASHNQVRTDSDNSRAVYGGGYHHEPGSAKRGFDDPGSAARFFYAAKASKRDRDDGNKHPTVKPTDLMRYLCRLVTPPGGIVLDPFMGSGSTGKAAVLEGFRFVGIERDAEYIEIARARIEKASAESDESVDDRQGVLPL